MTRHSNSLNMKTKIDSKDRYVIIMAGGRGERFWPVSREKTPKQLITLLGKKSFLQQTVDRVLPLVPLKNILIITNAVQAPTVRKQLPKLPKENVIAEPVGRDTCAAVTLGAAIVGARSTTAVMAVVPADHVIPEEKKFQQVLSDAFDLASRGQVIVTIGIKPHEPATGYGYIKTGNELPPPAGVKKYKTTFFKAEQFVEKPGVLNSDDGLSGKVLHQRNLLIGERLHLLPINTDDADQKIVLPGKYKPERERTAQTRQRRLDRVHRL